MKSDKKIRVAVLMGGPSAEHEVSLKSGENVLAALDKNKYEADTIFIDKAGNWEVEPRLLKNACDVAFIALHGKYGEDGTVQSILDEVGIPYTGSHALPSALAMNKYHTLRLLSDYGFTIPHSFLVSHREWNRNPFRVFDSARLYSGYPMVVKPNDNGSSVGVSIVNTKGELISALEKVFEMSRVALIQPFIEGREVTCGVLDYGWPKSAYPLLPTEIVPKVSNFFDYRAKYEPGGSAEITPARFKEPFIREIRRIATGVHRAIGASGFSRTDMIVDKFGRIYVLEVNTIPGLTKESLLPKAALASGISFANLLDRIISSAMRKYDLSDDCKKTISQSFNTDIIFTRK